MAMVPILRIVMVVLMVMMNNDDNCGNNVDMIMAMATATIIMHP